MARPRRPRVLRLLGSLAFLLAASACGFEAQTNQPYTPAMGVNADVGPNAALKVRNLLVVSRTPGQGFISASLISSRPDALVGVSGVAIKLDGSAGAPLQATLANPIPLDPGNLVVLTERPLIFVRSPDLVAGTSAEVVLRFEKAGEVSMRVPVYRNQDELVTVSPQVPTPANG